MKRTNIIEKHDARINRRVYGDKTMTAAVGEYHYNDGNGKPHAVIMSNVGTRTRELNRALDRVNRQIKARKTDVIAARELFTECTEFDRRAAAVASKPHNVATIRRRVVTAANVRGISEHNSDREALAKYATRALKTANKRAAAALTMRKTLINQLTAINGGNIILY